ncbi:MAG: transglutaminase-like domain-containing protein [Planctomycetaceae bacterium]
MSANSLQARHLGSKRPQVDLNQSEADEPSSLHLHWLTIAMALLAGIVFTLVEHGEEGHQHSNWCTFEILAQAIAVLLGTWFARSKLMGRNALIIPPILVMTIVLSLLCEPIQRTWFGTGHPFELLVMHCQSNLMLAIATCSFRRSYRQLCALLSLFLVIFCLTKSSSGLILSLFVVYSIVAIIWLIASHWAQVSRRAISDSKRRSSPLSWVFALPVIVGLGLLLSSDQGKAATDSVDGFMPSSGGSHDHHDHAHGGVKDGDALVAGEDNIQSFGPIEDAPFADDDKPSLYDAFNDTYDEPVVIKKTDRAIAIPPEDVREIEERIAKSRQAGREFSTIRRRDETKVGRIKDLNSQALFYVAGRTPVHFRMTTYDIFDGVDWFPSEPELVDRSMKMVHAGDRDWMRVTPGRGVHDVFSHRETHAVKVINLKGNVIPTPPHADAISIELVDRLDMFKAWDNGLMGLDRNNLPEMTAIQIGSDRIDPARLQDGFTVVWIPRSRTVTTALPKNSDSKRIKELATKWTAGFKRGPDVINCICEKLRARCELDRDAHVSSDADSPVSEFLFETRRGPEYMFATAAALLLRSQGYPTRLVGGFYARPEKYQARKRHTPVHTADAHFWCEVELGGDRWLTVEPSPGYEVLTPPPGLLARLRLTAVASIDFVRRHIWMSLAAFIAAMYAFIRRKLLIDSVRTAFWRLSRPSDNRNFALGSIGLIEQRLRLALGTERPVSATFGNWISSLNPLPPNREQLMQFAAIANRAAFDSRDIELADRRFCERVVQELTFGKMRQIHKQTKQKDQK